MWYKCAVSYSLLVFIWIYTRNLHWWNWSCQHYDLHLNSLWQFLHLQVRRKYLQSICCSRYTLQTLIINCWWVREMIHVASIEMIVANQHFRSLTFQADTLISDTMRRGKGAGHYSVWGDKKSLCKPLEWFSSNNKGCTMYPRQWQEDIVIVWGMWCSAGWKWMGGIQPAAIAYILCFNMVNRNK